MLKKQYKLFLILFLVLIVVGGIWAKGHYYSYNLKSLGERDFSIAADQTSQETWAAPLYFSFSKGDAILHVSDNLSADDIEILYFGNDGETTGQAAAKEFAYTNDMSGTIVAVAPEQQMDLDGDGTAENVLVCAKSQTTNSQSYAEYAWINHCFGAEQIPVEICYYGSGTSSTYMDLLVNGTPYTGTIHIASDTGLDTDMEIVGGALAGLSLREIRHGFTVTIDDTENNRVLIGNYIVEDYSLFGLSALDNFASLALMIVLIIAGAAVICLVRRKVGERAVAEVA